MVVHALNIELGAKPVVQPRRIFHPDVEAQIVQEVKKLLAAGFIKPIEHPQWLSNIVLVKKKERKEKMLCRLSRPEEGLHKGQVSSP